MPISLDAEDDIKKMKVAGFRVQLAFRAAERGKWMIQGTLSSGVEGQAVEQSFSTAAYPTRDEAEQEALRQAADLMGNNIDRNTSRVKNWPDRGE